MVAMIKAAVEHRGFAIVEVMSPCVTYNKINTYAWFKENVEDVTGRPDYAPNDRTAAFEALTREGDIPLGIIYKEDRPTFEDRTGLPEAPIARLNIREPRPEYAAMLAAYR
jgi:2-oxoglutarate ferredoxin oxidoreductase subunit beta